MVTPELCLCGYEFSDGIGTGWIKPPPDAWVRQLCRVGARERITVFLSHPERDRDTAKLHNSVFVIAPDGTIIGIHRKVHVVPVAEAWATPGSSAPVKLVSLFVCNRAGTDQTRDFTPVESVVVKNGTWLVAFHSPNSTLILVDWDPQAQELIGQRFLTLDLPAAGTSESATRVHP